MQHPILMRRLLLLVLLLLTASATAQGEYVYAGFGLGLNYGQTTLEGGARTSANIDVLTASLQSVGRRGQAELYVSRANGNETLTAFGATFGVFLARQRRAGGASEGVTVVLSGSISQSIGAKATAQAASVNMGFSHAVRVGTAMELVPIARVGNVFPFQEGSDSDGFFFSGALGLLLRGRGLQVVLEPSISSSEQTRTVGVSLRVIREQQ